MTCECCHSPLRRPINLYKDQTRYRTLIILYSISAIFFVIRLALVSNDISNGISGTIAFLVPILLLDLIGSVPLIVCSITYIIMRHCIKPLVGRQNTHQRYWRLGAMTCIRLDSHLKYPQLMLLVRISLILVFFLIRFISFVLGASCSTRFKQQCTAYTVIAAFDLFIYLLAIVVEFVNFFRLWTYNPTETRNMGGSNSVYARDTDTIITKTHRCHLCFIHHSIVNDKNTDGFRSSLCDEGTACSSQSLHHQLLYHSLESQRHISTTFTDDQEKCVIAFHQTNKASALDIAQNGFPVQTSLQLKQNISFTPSCTPDSTATNVIICVRLNLGRLITINTDGNPNLNQYFQGADGLYDTVYVENKRCFYLRMPGQIEKWIVMIPDRVVVNDVLDGSFYQGCL
jgi:hypothetical protein